MVGGTAFDRSLTVAVVECNVTEEPADLDALRLSLDGFPCLLVGVEDKATTPLRRLFDVVVSPDEPLLPAALDAAETNPHATMALAVLLRGARQSVGDGLAKESAVYSTLQDGPEFAAWRAATPLRARVNPDHPTVRAERDGHELTITLTRPEVHNAFSARMRDELLDALAIGLADSSITDVVLTGEGASFCSGGDLDEFGTRPDPATAHIVRLERSVGRVLAAMSERVTAHIHGATMGSGIELSAFAHRVIAHSDTRITLPEVGMGLIPGAGGTVSLPRRIGRHRTALLALSRAAIDAERALQWGLVDAIEA